MQVKDEVYNDEANTCTNDSDSSDTDKDLVRCLRFVDEAANDNGQVLQHGRVPNLMLQSLSAVESVNPLNN